MTHPNSTVRLILQHTASIQQLADASRDLCLSLYPVGTTVGVLLSSRQKTPTPGVVTGASNWPGRTGYVRVRLDTGRHPVMDVHVSDITEAP